MVTIERVIDADKAPAILELFAAAFNDAESYVSKVPSNEYFAKLLSNDNFVALAAYDGQQVIGALCAYVLPKFEQERSEIYLYDLAVTENHRRRRIATQLIEELRKIAAEIGAWVIFVQGDYGDEPALALYDKLGRREEVLHFDIDIKNPLC